MTDTDGPFDTKPWSEAQWARHAATWAPSGVYGTPAASTTTGDLPLSVSGLSVGLGAGRAWVRGFGFERTGAAVMQTVTANTHASFSRRDRIVLRRNLATHLIAPVLLTGTPSGSPVAPALTQSEAGSWDIPLFSFLVPPNSGTSISGLVDERVWVDAGRGGDTGWITLAAPGWTVGFNRYRILNGVCHWYANLTRSSWGPGAAVTTFPAEARPSMPGYAFGTIAKEMYDIAVNETGAVNVAQAGTGGLVIAGSWPVG